MGKYLHTTIPDRFTQYFIDRFICRNEPELDLPPLTNETRYISLKPAEIGLCIYILY